MVPKIHLLLLFRYNTTRLKPEEDRRFRLRERFPLGSIVDQIVPAGALLLLERLFEFCCRKLVLAQRSLLVAVLGESSRKSECDFQNHRL